MRKSIKKSAILLAAALMAMPMTVAAEEAAITEVPGIVQENGATSGTMGHNNGIRWNYDTATKTLTITGKDSGFFGVYDETTKEWNSPFLFICPDVEKIVLNDCSFSISVTSVFENLVNVKTIEFNNVDTSEVTTMDSMFQGCSSLESLDLSGLNTENVEYTYSMFSGCSALKSLDISNFDTSKVVSMCMMFENCSSLESLDVSSFNTKNVKDMWNMFCGCSSLQDLDVSNFDTANVTAMEGMFSGCVSLESLDLSNFNTSKVKRMWGMFSDCTALRTVDVSSFDTSNVEQMFDMFGECSSLESLDLSNFNTDNVTYMGGMFANDFSLKTLDISSFNTENVISMDLMFMCCHALENLDVSNFDTSKVTDMSYMFRGCKALETLDVSNFDTSKVTDVSYMFYDCDLIERLDISNFDMSKVTNAEDMLTQCDNLNTIITPQSMASDITADFSGTFHDAEGNELTELSLMDCNKVLIAWENGSRNMALEADYAEVTVGNILQLQVVVDDEVQPVDVCEDYIWTVEDDSVVTVSNTGEVTGVGVGETTVTCVHKVDSLEKDTYEIAIKVPFTDIKVKDWQYPYVVYAYENNLMSGKGDTFDMKGKLTRAQFVTVLYSNAGKPDVTYEQQFSDVTNDKYYAEAVTWAKQEGISAGYADGSFGVKNNIQRQQLVLMLYNYAKENGVVTEAVIGDLSAYADESEVKDYAREALIWAVQNGIIQGKNRDGENYLDPTGSTNRGQCATMMMRYVELSNT